jgi:hypothetical protein
MTNRRIAKKKFNANPFLLTRTDRKLSPAPPCGCYQHICPEPKYMGAVPPCKPFAICTHECPDDVHGQHHFINAELERQVLARGRPPARPA